METPPYTDAELARMARDAAKEERRFADNAALLARAALARDTIAWRLLPRLPAVLLTPAVQRRMIEGR